VKRLFMLRSGKGGAPVKGPISGLVLYFSAKPEAKKARDEIGGNTVVSFGPDHVKFNKNGV